MDTGKRGAGKEILTTSVIALHCSGAGAKQWRSLGDALGPGYRLIAPEHYGCDATGSWAGLHAFTLADEAAKVIKIIDRNDRKVHLVGHSYGGGVALHVALERPDRISSLALYEPSAFHLLKALGDDGAPAFAEILHLVRKIDGGVLSGDYRHAAATGAWAALRPSVQDALTHWMPKAPLDFRALIKEPTPLSAYARLCMPVLIMQGEYAPRPAQMIAETLARQLPQTRRAVIEGAGHMGPLTHASTISRVIADHMEATEMDAAQGVPAITSIEASTIREASSFAAALP